MTVTPAACAASMTSRALAIILVLSMTSETAPCSTPPSDVKSFWNSIRTTAVVAGSRGMTISSRGWSCSHANPGRPYLSCRRSPGVPGDAGLSAGRHLRGEDWIPDGCAGPPDAVAGPARSRRRGDRGGMHPRLDQGLTLGCEQPQPDPNAVALPQRRHAPAVATDRRAPEGPVGRQARRSGGQGPGQQERAPPGPGWTRPTSCTSSWTATATPPATAAPGWSRSSTRACRTTSRRFGRSGRWTSRCSARSARSSATPARPAGCSGTSSTTASTSRAALSYIATKGSGSYSIDPNRVRTYKGVTYYDRAVVCHPKVLAKQTKKFRSGPPKVYFPYASTAAEVSTAKGKAARTIHVPWKKGHTYDMGYSYDAKSGRYLRSMPWGPHTLANGKRVATGQRPRHPGQAALREDLPRRGRAPSRSTTSSRPRGRSTTSTAASTSPARGPRAP